MLDQMLMGKIKRKHWVSSICKLEGVDLSAMRLHQASLWLFSRIWTLIRDGRLGKRCSTLSSPTSLSEGLSSRTLIRISRSAIPQASSLVAAHLGDRPMGLPLLPYHQKRMLR